jgi:hypothetical protein
VVEFLEEVVNGAEVGSHVCLLSPALPHDVDCLRRRGAFTHGRANQRRRALHLLNDICRQTSSIGFSNPLHFGNVTLREQVLSMRESSSMVRRNILEDFDVHGRMILSEVKLSGRGGL